MWAAFIYLTEYCFQYLYFLYLPNQPNIIWKALLYLFLFYNAINPLVSVQSKIQSFTNTFNLEKEKKTLTYRLSNLLLKMPKLRWKQNNKLCTLYVFQHAVINRGLTHNSNPPEKTAKVKIQEKIQDLWRNASEPLLEIREETECEMPSEICKA